MQLRTTPVATVFPPAFLLAAGSFPHRGFDAPELSTIAPPPLNPFLNCLLFFTPGRGVSTYTYHKCPDHADPEASV
jgi:hypothetical protein